MDVIFVKRTESLKLALDGKKMNAVNNRFLQNQVLVIHSLKRMNLDKAQLLSEYVSAD